MTRIPHLGYCPDHSKLTYTSRKHARQAIRQMREPGMRAYQCATRTGMWHTGHLPPAIREGRLTAADLWPVNP